MGAITDSLGIGGGTSAGGHWNARSADLINPVIKAQTDVAYNYADTGIHQQQDFLNALAAQNGIANQSAVYNQLAGVAAGTGPNPAQAMLNQQTGNNIASQAALMAGQRGAGANTGLLARQAGQQGAGIQQQAVGQGASMEAQQRLAALGQMQGLSTQQVGQQAQGLAGYNQTAQNEQGLLLNAVAEQNKSNVAMQSNVNNANAQIANTNAQGQQGLIGGVLGGVGNVVGGLFAKGGEVPQKFAKGGAKAYEVQNGKYVEVPTDEQMSAGASPMSAPTAPTTPQTDVSQSAVAPVAPAMPAQAIPQKGPKSSVGQYLAGTNPSPTGMQGAGQAVGNLIGKGIGAGIGAIGSLFGSSSSPMSDTMQSSQFGQEFGGQSPSVGYDNVGSSSSGYGLGADTNLSTPISSLSPGDIGLARGGKIPPQPIIGEQLAAKGKLVPGKAKVKGDSLKNDTVNAKLSPGEIVIPRSIAQGQDAPRKAAEFVAAILRKQGGMR